MARLLSLRQLILSVFSRRKRATFVRAERPEQRPRRYSSIAAEKAVMEHQRKLSIGRPGSNNTKGGGSCD